jgi:hypothetical protein
MSVGAPVTKTDLDARAGNIALRFQQSFEDVLTMQGYLAATVDTDLEALGYTASEVATLKTAFADLTELGTIWTGAAALQTAKDFRVFVRQLWGMGAF